VQLNRWVGEENKRESERASARARERARERGRERERERESFRLKTALVAGREGLLEVLR